MYKELEAKKLIDKFISEYDFRDIETKLRSSIKFYKIKGSENIYDHLNFSLRDDNIYNIVFFTFCNRTGSDISDLKLINKFKDTLYIKLESIVLKIVEENRVK